MKKSRVLASLVAGLCPLLADAGIFSAPIVSIDRTHLVASGSLTGARLNAGGEFIRCSVSMQSRARNIRDTANCSARDRAGITASCSTTEPDLIAAVLAINPASEVRFGWDVANACTFIAVVQSSANVE